MAARSALRGRQGHHGVGGGGIRIRHMRRGPWRDSLRTMALPAGPHVHTMDPANRMMVRFTVIDWSTRLKNDSGARRGDKRAQTEGTKFDQEGGDGGGGHDLFTLSRAVHSKQQNEEGTHWLV